MTSPLKTMLRRTLLLLLLALVGCAPALASHPALWEAHDGDTTVYFFGTVHVVPKDLKWRFPALDKALGKSQVLYLEAADIDPATVQPLIMQYGLDPTHPLSTKISASENELLKKAASALGLPGGAAALDMMKPWLAGITVATAPLLKAGYDPTMGVDKQLQAQMDEAGTPVKGLETAKEQMLFLAKLPESVQLALLRKSLHEYAHAESELQKIVNAWKAGDVQALASVIVGQMKAGSPKLYQTLIVKRNEAWSKQIAKLMKGTSGTVFVAVGSGHLVGPDRLQVQLAKQGIDVQRIATQP